MGRESRAARRVPLGPGLTAPQRPLTLEDIRQAYQACVAGTETPSAGYMSGLTLNLMDPADPPQYDPDGMYVATASGITRVTV